MCIVTARIHNLLMEGRPRMAHSLPGLNALCRNEIMSAANQEKRCIACGLTIPLGHLLALHPPVRQHTASLELPVAGSPCYTQLPSPTLQRAKTPPAGAALGGLRVRLSEAQGLRLEPAVVPVPKRPGRVLLAHSRLHPPHQAAGLGLRDGGGARGAEEADGEKARELLRLVPQARAQQRLHDEGAPKAVAHEVHLRHTEVLGEEA
mmetsp:Transcript_41695/g.116180  ORF Transcript_41695/g.116180 Transcript_41695/m.116180 type:complete len:206 (-) Transcript_41695:602-1219(-)